MFQIYTLINLYYYHALTKMSAAFGLMLVQTSSTGSNLQQNCKNILKALF